MYIFTFIFTTIKHVYNYIQLVNTYSNAITHAQNQVIPFLMGKQLRLIAQISVSEKITCFRCQNVKTKKFVHKSKTYSGSPAGPKTNRASIIFAAKRNDYERVKILYRYGYRLQKKDSMTDPLKKIELFKVSKSKFKQAIL